MLSVFLPLIQLILIFLVPIYIVVIWGFTLPTLLRHLNQAEFSQQRGAELVRFIFSPITVAISFLAFILAPFLALLGLVLLALGGIVVWPLSLLVRYLPRFILDLLAKIGALGEKIMKLDTVLVTNFYQRLLDLMRALLGTVGSMVIGFPWLISFVFRGLQKNVYVRERVIKDIRRFEGMLRADVAVDLLLAIAQDSHHREDSRIEAIRLLGEIGRPVSDFLHIISVPGIDPKIAIEAANQAEQSLTISAVAQKDLEGMDMRAIPIWERLAAHPHAEPQLRAAQKLFLLGERDKALEVLYGLMADSKNNTAESRALAARQLYETGLMLTDPEARTQELLKAERYLELMTKSRNPRDRLEGASSLVRIRGTVEGQPELVKTILDLLDDAYLDPEVRRRALDLLAELNLVSELRFAIEKHAPTPEQEWEHRIEAIKAMEKVHSEEAVKYWAELAAQPALPAKDARAALSAIRRLCSEAPGGAGWKKAEINTIEVQQGFGALRELGSNQEMPAALRLEAADTLEALDQIKDANAIYYVLQNDPTVDKRINRKAASAVRRLDRLLLVNRPGRSGSPEA